ncbi:MAG: HDOD domain-containing protein [Candidatus Hydrogenedentes bacterium]|nr:HDOD domain-containing protein [Candidatus Hydrogenedentota bacterium]
MTVVRNIDFLLDGIVTLPSLPASVAWITQLINSPKSNLSEVGQAIHSDPALALKTLRLVNSAYYGLTHKVTSVDHAVSLLGLKVIKNLVYTATVFDSFRKGTDELLRHSVSCGIAMKVLSECVPQAGIDGEEAFIYGLVHDIGKIVLSEFMPEDIERASALSYARRVPGHVAEWEVIGTDHAEVGGRLVLNWGLSKTLSMAITSHHDLNRCKDPKTRPLAACIAVADYLCNVSGILSSQESVPSIHDEMWTASGIKNSQIPTVVDRFCASLYTVDELIHMAK